MMGQQKVMVKELWLSKEMPKSQEVLYVDGLKHDLLIVGQICDANQNITFFSHHCEIRRNGSQRIIGKGA